VRINICKTTDLKPGQTKSFRFGLWQGILVCDEDGFHAFKNFCSHMGGPVRKCGDCTFKCDWHGATFDMKTGKAHPGSQAPEGTGLPPIHITIDGDQVFCDYEPPKDPFSD
jgi:nitrite reductase/ring-hydroxylating ferredoxin subunit